LDDEHSFVILLRATDWLNVYLFVVRAIVVVVAVSARRSEHVCSTICIWIYFSQIKPYVVAATKI